MERIAQNRSATLTQTFYVDGVATNPSPDAATVQITGADGTVLVAETAATEGGTGIVTYTVTPTQTALLDTWTVTWQATVGGQEQTYVDHVEVVGGFLFSIAEAKATSGLSTLTTASIVATRTMVETTLERACGRAFVPRYSLETFNGDGSVGLFLKPDIRLIRTVTVNAVAYTAGQIAGLALSPTGLLTNTLGTWPLGSSNITIGYEHGCAYPPPDITRAALLAAQEIYATTGEGRVVRREADGQAVTYASPSFAGGFSDPVVRSIIRDYDLNVGVA